MMTYGRTISALMIAPVFWLGIGTTEHVMAAAERAARGETQPAPLTSARTRYAVDPDGIRWLKSVVYRLPKAFSSVVVIAGSYV